MERILVGVTTLVLLCAHLAPVRAGYLFPRRVPGPGNNGGSWLSLVESEPFGDGIIAVSYALPREGILRSLGDPGSRPFFEVTTVAVVFPASGSIDELLKGLVRRLATESPWLVMEANERLDVLPAANLCGTEQILFGDRLIADLANQRNDSVSEDPFLAKFGILGKRETPVGESARRVPNSPTSRLWSEKLLWSLAFVGVGLIGLISYVWRQLRAKPNRNLVGRRPHTAYRTSNFPHPPRTYTSPPPGTRPASEKHPH